MEESDGLEEVTQLHDPEKGSEDQQLDRVASSTGSDEKRKQGLMENVNAESAPV